MDHETRLAADAGTAVDLAYHPLPIPAQAVPTQERNQEGGSTAFYTSALFAAGIASFAAFHGHDSPKPAVAKPAAHPSIQPSVRAQGAEGPEAGLVPLSLDAQGPAAPAPASDGLFSFSVGGLEPSRADLPAPAAQAAEEPSEPMLEHAAQIPRLRSIANFINIAERTMRDDGFEVIHLKKQVAATSAFYRTPQAEAPKSHAAAYTAAVLHGLANIGRANAAPTRQFLSQTRGHQAALTGTRGSGWGAALAAPAAAQGAGWNQIAGGSGQLAAAGGTVTAGANQAAAQPYQPDMRSVNTNAVPEMNRDCGVEYQCSTNNRGQRVYTFKDGTRMIHQSYDQSQDYGDRNAWLVESPDGKAFQFKSSPLVFDLKGKGVRMSDKTVRYDIDGDGKEDAVHDIASTTGVLVFDSDHSGISGKNGRELFGNQTDLDGDGKPDGFQDGFAALDGMLRKAVREGVLPGASLKLGYLGAADLKELEKSYGLKMRVGSLKAKAVSLAEAGVQGIWLSKGAMHRISDFDSQGDDVLRQAGAVFTRTDGTSGSYEDVWFNAAAQKLRFVQNPWAAPAKVTGGRPVVR